MNFARTFSLAVAFCALATGPGLLAQPSERIHVILDTDANNELDSQRAVACLLLSGDVSNVADVSPIVELQRVRPKASVWKDSTWRKPFVLKSAKDAAEHFEADSLADLLRQVDFERQFVLLFAWRGSGQDRLEVEVAESYPEQITFIHQPGRTRDLRQHARAYALRSNVTWRVR